MGGTHPPTLLRITAVDATYFLSFPLTFHASSFLLVAI
jgi:hypothetical protein